ncbi:MAG TPA: cell division protein ZipA C-terminal FtsZ-binding domain-containing protein [Azonexus sp.]|nr:cell division protein ZipA C-terminal FtsZ-binding domain-containing protein [Azonexus sp.]
MTELQMGLIGLGVAAVFGVFGYNKWQEMRQRKVAEAVLKPHHEDVLLAKGGKTEPEAVPAVQVERSEPEIRIEASEPLVERVEPVFTDPTPTEVVDDMAMAPEDTPMPEMPVIAQPAPGVPPVVAKPAVSQPEADDGVEVEAGNVPDALLDPRLEFVVTMELVEPVSSFQILHSQRSALHRLNKPVHWVGFNEKKREWQRLTPDAELELRRLRVGLQLVNRLGPVSEGDLVIFTNAMQALADELMAVADMPPSNVLDQAAEIDRFCAAVDLEIGLNLVSRGSAFPGTKIRALSEAAGMVLGADGLFTRYDDAGRAQFSLQNFESTPFSPDALRNLTTHGLTFLLDVPRVDHGERVFMQMTEVAKRFADTLQGALVDDNRQPLSDSQLDHIRREFIGKPQATMASFGLAAGSPQALRLFS